MACPVSACSNSSRECADRSPQSIYASQEQVFPPRMAFPDQVFEEALARRPTILYFHGNVCLIGLASKHRSDSRQLAEPLRTGSGATLLSPTF